MSRGQRIKAALLSALAYRPQLVVLDEPFSGLDRLVRDEFLTGLLELTDAEGWTVLISSHDIEEVERFADRVAIINAGRIDLQEDVELLRERFRGVELGFDEQPVMPDTVPDYWLNPQVSGRTILFGDENYDESSSPEISWSTAKVRGSRNKNIFLGAAQALDHSATGFAAMSGGYPAHSLE